MVIPTIQQIDQNEAVRSPVAVVEILSASTEGFDKNEKFEKYKQVESLRHYLLIEQDAVFVTHHAKNADGVWGLAGTYNSLTNTIPVLLDDAQITLSVGEIYASLSFNE